MSLRPLEVFRENRELLEDYLCNWGLEKFYGQMYMAYDIQDECELIRAANRAWIALPDRRDIRESGFFKLCDIAEYIFE